MRESLADNLNLAGTARHNLSMCHARLLTSRYQNPTDRKKMPAAWEDVVPFFNHSELWYVNQMAKTVGCAYPFPHAEVLLEDNGERFFSQYMSKTLPAIRSIKRGEHGECLCNSCATSTRSQQHEAPLLMNDKPTNNNEHESVTTTINNEPTAAVSPTTTVTNRKTPAKHRSTREPTQCAVANNSYMQPAPNYVQAMCCLMPQLIPMQYQLPLCMTPSIPTVCCQKYAEWMKRRLGRPPHHQLCQNR